jgi:threonine dehydrogenase-like Zn-dependent dehydrogenase
VLAAEGRIATADPVVLGHEFAGTIDAVGPAVHDLRVGDPAAVCPVLPCGHCPTCFAADPINCPHRTMLGIDRDGAFAEFVVVPAACVFPVPNGLAFAVAAYAEPVAAALAVFNAGLDARQQGTVLGRNRFATLVTRLLKALGFHQVTTDADVAADSVDFAIETRLTENTLSQLFRIVRPGGTIVIKSRVPGGILVDFTAAIRKQIAIRAVNYGSFRRAIGLLAEGQLEVADLIGSVRPLDDFAAVFAAEKTESIKLFLSPTGASCAAS